MEFFLVGVALGGLIGFLIGWIAFAYISNQ
jgi:hypothetical protein